MHNVLTSICRSIVAPVLLFGVLLSSCKSDTTTTPSVFKYNQSSGISSLDPAFAKDQANIWATNLIYNGLVQLNEDLEVIPDVAKQWTISEDGLTYTFYLREDVFFHDHPQFEEGKGRQMTAKDVVYSLQRVIDPSVASPGAWIFNGKVQEENPFVAIDDFTVEIRLKEAFRPMLGILTMQYTHIVPEEVVAHYGKDFRSNAVGTGPFTLKTWDEGNALILSKNPNYHEFEGDQRLPYLDGVKVSFMDDKKTAYLSFLKGELDFISGIDGSYIDEVINSDGTLKEEHEASFDMFRSPYLNTEYLGFNMQLPDEDPLSEQLIRQAINFSFDRGEIIQYMRNGIGIPANAGFIPAGLPSFNDEVVQGYTFDTEKSLSLLAEAGYPNGIGLPEITLTTTASYEDMGSYVAKQMENLGMKVKIELQPAGLLRERMAKGTVPFFRGSWIADYPDGESYLAMFYSPYGAPPNYTHFQSDRFDELYEQALSENDDTKRYALYQEMDQMLVDQAPVVPLYYDEVVRFVRRGVSGMEPNPINLLDLTRVQKSEM